MTKYDLKDRTYNFAVTILRYCASYLNKPDCRDLKSQLIRSGTSVGANVEEADGACSRKDFAYKMTVARNEAKETRYWLRLILDSEIVKNSDGMNSAKELIQESGELIKILSSIIDKINIK